MNICKILNNIEIDHVVSNKDLFDKAFDSDEFDNEASDYEESDNKASDYEESENNVFNNKEYDNEVINNKGSNDKVLDNEEIDYENFFYNEMLNDEITINFTNEVLSEKELDKVIDKVLNTEKIPSIGREYSLYFNNFTETLMFCWIQKHSITSQAYDELVDIIHNLQFKSKDIVMNDIVKIITIAMLYNKNNINVFSIFIHEILYKHQGCWKLRDIIYSYKHLSEFAVLDVPDMNLLVYKLYINFYYDDFGIFHMQRNPSLVIASLGDVTANLLQDNNLVGVKRHVFHYHHLTDNQFKEISIAPTITKYKELTTIYRLHLLLPILDRLKRERHLQFPHDIYHLIASKVLKFFKITIKALSSESKSEFMKYWKSFKYPRTWQKLPNLIFHIDNFMILDCLHLAMMIPFILNRFLKLSSFKNPELTSFQSHIGVSKNDLA
ncbi:26201_t:CDS:2 [Racocetra persica]|uniref:26201_t:CDS:1 n=1 Tax=Racocetra persica TaxID=160502 RepID=A0ACA9KW71_9GLOM|nr:26201_t:CDS:2 [Racocetra persica]